MWPKLLQKHFLDFLADAVGQSSVHRSAASIVRAGLEVSLSRLVRQEGLGTNYWNISARRRPDCGVLVFVSVP